MGSFNFKVATSLASLSKVLEEPSQAPVIHTPAAWDEVCWSKYFAITTLPDLLLLKIKTGILQFG